MVIAIFVFQWNIVVSIKVDDVEAFPNYPYRDDALLIFEAIQTYAREVLQAFYGEIWKSVNELLCSIWCSGFIVSALNSGSSGLDGSPGQGHCVAFLGKTLNCHSAPLHPGV